MLRSILIAAICLFSTTVHAQDTPRAILVLDGSGSMWGQIDGKAKITIAQEVVSALLQTLPANQELGLTVYGHRRKGDCSDIETIITPGGGQRDAIARAVNAIKPKGKTPMTDAVIAAAKALRYTEEKATVILVSDGIETCNPDPCAAAMALEKAGVDFTAHVVGFNISDPAAIAQMQCLASETGGRFLSADNADELAAALVTVAATPEPAPEPVPVEITFAATLEVNGPAIDHGLVWVFNDDVAETSEPGGQITRALLPGEYGVSVTRLEDETSVSAQFFVEKLSKQVVLVLPKITHKAEISAVATSPIGATIDVTWSAETVGERDYISVAVPGDKATGYAAYTYVEGAGALPLRLPLVPGDYELRYVRNADGEPDEVLAVQMITLGDIAATLEAAAEVGAGSQFEVVWDGPNYQNDYISIAVSDARSHHYEAYSYTGKGSPSNVKAPLDPGTYELRYVANGNPDRILGTRSIDVVANAAVLSAPDQAVAGVALDVIWEGPDNKNDYISVATPDDEPHGYLNYAYTRNTSPASVKMPLEPGVYQLRYIANGSPDKILATRTITIIAAEVALDAPAEAVSGSIVDVIWTGPANKNDYVSVAEIGAAPNHYANYKYTANGSPAAVKMPLDPGTYELRYVANGSPSMVLSTRAITIVAAQVSLEAPQQAVAGSVVEVTWGGPDNQNDYVSVAEPGAAANQYSNYKYTSRGSPALVTMPLEPGDYQLRYVANGSPSQVLATRAITIVAANVVLDAPEQGVVGSPIDVSYVGPDNPNDFISIAKIGADAGKYDNYQYTNRGNPVTLKLPEATGTYLIRYIASGSPKKVLARRSIKVVEASAEPAATAILEAAETAAAATEIEVFWVGPDGEGDTIIISKIGSTEPLAKVATAQGNPAVLKMPDTSGQYMLHYLSGTENRSLGARPIDLN